MVRSKVCTGRSFDIKGRSFEYPLITEVHRFNDQSLTPYTGDTANFGFNTTDPIEGGASLQCSAADNNILTSQPGGGLNHYPSKGEKWHIYLRCSQVAVAPNLVQRVRFGRTDSNNFYQIQINWDDLDNWTLFKKTAGTFTILDQDNNITGNLDPNTYYEIIVTWDDGSLGGDDNDITAVLREVDGGTIKSTMFANDPDHATQSGIAFQVDNDIAATFDWDDWRVL